MTKITSTKKNYIYGFSYARSFAAVAVILLHMIFASLIYYGDKISNSELLIFKIIRNQLMWAVPIFLMVTGALMLDIGRKTEIKKLFSKYIKRLVLALVIFTFLFNLMDVLIDHEPVIKILTGWFSSLIFGKSWAHMWYLYLMIGIYLMLPFYQKITNNSSKKELLYLELVLVVFTSLLPMAKIFGYEIGFYIPTGLIYPSYLLAGYMIHNDMLLTSKKTAIYLLVLSTAALILFSCLRYGRLQDIWDVECLANFDKVVFGYSGFLVFIQSISIFKLFDLIKINPNSNKKILLTFDDTTFGIYLVHMFFIRLVFKKFAFNPYMGVPAINFIVLLIVITILSFVVVWFIRKFSNKKFL